MTTAASTIPTQIPPTQFGVTLCDPADDHLSNRFRTKEPDGKDRSE
jgi:hypothetical protein